ncbi:MAG: hypothetical protein K5886_03200 [Lachnospiraceae bacterium]|nr:hypothetical protein [Lachnospiraceae bacterium]
MNDRRPGVSDSFRYTIRLVVGGYLLYTDYSVFDYFLSRTGWEKIGLGAVLILFLVAGVYLIITSLKELLQKGRDKDVSPEDPGIKVTESRIEASDKGSKDEAGSSAEAEPDNMTGSITEPETETDTEKENDQVNGSD